MDRKIAALLKIKSWLWLGVLLAGGTATAQVDSTQIDLASHYHSLGANYINDGVLDSAVHYTAQAVERREALFATQPNLDLGKSNNNLGVAHNNLGNYTAAIPFLNRAIEVFSVLDLPREQQYRLLNARVELAAAKEGLGDYSTAKSILRLAAAEASQAPELQIRPILELGTLQFNQDSFTNAATFYQQVEERFQELERTAPDLIDFDVALYTIFARFNLANVNFQLGEDTLAERQYLAVLPYLEAYELVEYEALLHNNLAALYTKTGQFTQAETALQHGLQKAEAVKSIRLLAQNTSHWGEWHLAQGRPAAAVAAQQQAQAVLIPGYQPNDLFQTPSVALLKTADYRTDLFIYLGDQARALDAMPGNAAEKISALSDLFQTGDALLDALRRLQSGQGSKLFWREKTSAFYERAIRHCQANALPEEAFRFFEKSKAVLLHEALLGNDALRVLPDSLREKDNQLARQLTDAKAAASGSDEAALLNNTVVAEQQLEAFRGELRAAYSNYRVLTGNTELPTAASFFQQHLQEQGQVLVHYFYGQENVFALVLTPAGVVVTDLGPSERITDLVTEVLGYFTAATDIQNDPAGYAAAAHVAYRALLEPLKLPAGQSLLIIPDGPLTYLPFPALLTKAPATTDRLGELPYLLRQHPIRYGHSASILSREQPRNAPGALIAFAPFTDGSSPSSYPTLAFSQDELGTVTANYAHQLYKDQNATLADFRAQAPSAHILHLSTHAFASTGATEPLIAFYDRPLYLSKLYHEKLNADLVVLSACQTNVGQLIRGEGVLGLGRGFIQAGAQSIIASLWKVNARSSGRILSDFYDRLAVGERKGAALHQAQLGYLQDPAIRDLDKSPYLWAGLTYYGADTHLPLAKSADLGWLWGLCLLGGLALAVLIVLKFRHQ